MFRKLLAHRSATEYQPDLKRPLRNGSYWIKAKKKKLGWIEIDNLLTKNDTFYIPPDQPGQHLQTWLFNEIYFRFLTIYPGRNKTKKLFRIQYYWPDISGYVDIYYHNCHICHRTNEFTDKITDLLQSFPIIEKH